MKRLLIFDEEGFYLEEKIANDNVQPKENQYIAELDEIISFYKPKLVDGVIIEGREQWEFDEEAINSSLTPSDKEQEEAEFEIKMINLLLDLGLL